MNSHSSQYTVRAQVEDMLALLSAIQEHQRTIMLHAFQCTDFQVIYDEASRQAGKIAHVRRILRGYWCEIQAVIEAANEG